MKHWHNVYIHFQSAIGVLYEVKGFIWQQQWSRPKFMQIILSFLWEYNDGILKYMNLIMKLIQMKDNLAKGPCINVAI